MRPDLHKFVDDYMLMLGQKDTFRSIMEKSGPECTAILLQILEEQGDPRLKLRVITDWLHWLKQWYPPFYADSSTTVPAALNPVEQHALVLEGKIRMGDVIQLVAKTPAGTAMIERRGSWWRTIQAHDHDPKKPHLAGTRPPSWFLKSLTRKEQGLPAIAGDKKSPFDNMWIRKHDDPDYRIVNICSFPKEFKHKEWLGVENVIKTTFDKP